MCWKRIERLGRERRSLSKLSEERLLSEEGGVRNGKAIPSKAILRQDKLSRIFVGAGALDSPLGGARFELSRAYVENIMWITQMRL